MNGLLYMVMNSKLLRFFFPRSSMKLLYIPILLVGLIFSSCATILSSGKQKVTFTANLPDTKVYINDNFIGNTPLTAKVAKKKANAVRFQHERGSANTELNGHFMGGYLFLDLLFGGGLLGIIVDASTNAWLRYPKTLYADIPVAHPTLPAAPVSTPVAYLSTPAMVSDTKSSPGTVVASRSGQSAPLALANSTTPRSTQRATNSTNNSLQDDPFGLNQKKAVLGQLIDALPKKGIPSGANPTDKDKVYVFLVGRKNVTTYTTSVLSVRMYSDSTWLSTKDTRMRFANAIGLPVDRIVLAGFFEDSLMAQQAWLNFSDKATENRINQFPVAFAIEPTFIPTVSPTLAISPGVPAPKPKAQATRVVNLPDVEITGKYRPTLGIMPIIDAETNLNQQFLVYQYLKDNPVIINQKDTLQASLSDYRAYTQFSLGGVMNENSYLLKLWQKEKPIAEIVINVTPKATLEERMTLIGRQVGRMLSGDTDNYTIRENPRTQGLYDYMDVIKSEVRKGTEISRLFPDATTHYLPPGLSLPSGLGHLSSRINNLPYLKTISPNSMAQAVRSIYQQTDEKQFFFTNGNIPDEMKDAARRVTQPTSRRIGSALSYVGVGDAFRESEGNLDGAACSYYSALLLSHNLAASSLEKATVKQLIYQRMKQVAETRKQPYLAGLFSLAADLNSSYASSEFATQSHKEYYEALKKTADLCLTAESQARAIRAQQRTNTLMALGAVAGAAAVASTAGSALTNAAAQQLTNQLTGLQAVTKNMQSVFAESVKDMKYENFEMRDESGNEIELNKLYLNMEILWHLGLRKDKDVVGKRLLEYAADKPNLKIALEEYLAETDENQQAVVISEFQDCFQNIEAQANRYESWGRQLPRKVVGRF